eukprot:m51a1_g717 putative protein (1684) ;mRNA; f:430093-442653
MLALKFLLSYVVAVVSIILLTVFLMNTNSEYMERAFEINYAGVRWSYELRMKGMAFEALSNGSIWNKTHLFEIIAGDAERLRILHESVKFGNKSMGLPDKKDTMTNRLDTECKRKDGTTFPASCSIVGFFKETKPFFALFIRDNTGEKRKEELLNKEKQSYEALLLSVLPRHVANRIKNGETMIFDSVPMATILFADIVNFTPWAAETNSADLIKSLNKLFGSWDELLLTKYREIEKIKTIGDSYMAATGIADDTKDMRSSRDSKRAASMVNFAMDMIGSLEFTNKELFGETGKELRIRIGINSGPVTAGVVGSLQLKPNYDIFGMNVNVASRMESSGTANKIQLSRNTYELVFDSFECDEYEKDVKGIGKMQTYIIRGAKTQTLNGRAIGLFDDLERRVETTPDGHFARAGKRVRFWGVNLCYSANFPSHDEAVVMADRMQQAGVNIPFPFDSLSPDSLVAGTALLNGRAIGAGLQEPWVAATPDGHFARAGSRVRFWGVNLCFSANFPAHDEAVIMADRMQQAGVNIVRFHHMDSNVYPNGLWKNGQELSDAAMERLEFLIAELAKRGIYANINLHVDKQWSETLNLTGWELMPEQDKIVPFITPAVREKHMVFATMILSHRNRYRGNVTFSMDPAIAMVEISNENSLFTGNADSILNSLPPYFDSEVQKLFSKWLKNKYSTNAQLRAAWAPQSVSLCNGSLSDTVCTPAQGAANLIKAPLSAWHLETHFPAKAAITVTSEVARITVENNSAPEWYLQFNTAGLSLSSTTTYTLSFAARALSGTRNLFAFISMANGTFSELGLSQTATLSPQWKTFTVTGMIKQSYPNCRVSFSFGSSMTAFELKDPILAPSSCDYAHDNLRNWDMWALSVASTASATMSADPANSGVTINVAKADGTSWNVGYQVGSIHVKKGVYYSFSSQCKSNTAVTVSFGVCQSVGFTSPADDDRIRVVFNLGYSAAIVSLRNASLAPGGCTGLDQGESIDTVKPFPGGDAETRGRYFDRVLFKAFLEKDYFDSLRSHIKDTLGYKGLVTGTIKYGVLGAYGQSGMDFVDSHSYWHHPQFPHKPWDSVDWLVVQQAMSQHPESATFWGLVRVDGKPFTITEYNHPAPLDSQSETVPMIAAWAAIQDVDAVFLFAYSHSIWHVKGASQHTVTNFFDIDYNPAKWTFMKQASMIVQLGQIPSLRANKVIRLAEYTPGDMATVIETLSQKQGLGLQSMWQGSGVQDYISKRMSLALGTWSPSEEGILNGEPPSVSWNASIGLSVSSSRAIVFSGVATTAAFSWGSMAFAGSTPLSMMVTPMDNKQLAESSQIMITVVGRVESTGMIFNQDRTSVGKDWGVAPPLCESAVVIARDRSLALDFDASRPALWYALSCNRSVVPDEPVTEPSSADAKSGSCAAQSVTRPWDYVGAESFAVSPLDGLTYTGLGDGRIIRFDPRGHAAPETFATTGKNCTDVFVAADADADVSGCGRPLGLAFDGAGVLWVADAWAGVLTVHPNGTVDSVLTEVGGVRLVFADSIAVDKGTGLVYFTELSRVHPIQRVYQTVLSGERSGTVVQYNPRERTARVLARGLACPNGIVLTHDSAALVVTLTAQMSLAKLWIDVRRQLAMLPLGAINAVSMDHAMLWEVTEDGAVVRALEDTSGISKGGVYNGKPIQWHDGLLDLKRGTDFVTVTTGHLP